MDSTLIVADNFTPNVEGLREKVLSSEFKTETGPDGFEYTGICLENLPDLDDRISELVGFKIKEVFSCYRLNYVLEVPHNFVHSDRICGEYGGILYLNTPEQCLGGTAFWRHKHCGWDAMPKDEELEEKGVDTEAFGREMMEEWKQREPWDMTGFVGMKSNRFLTYPTRQFHSRYPHEAFGDSKDNARLIWAVFYDRA